MTSEQAALILDIVSQLDVDSTWGVWPHEQCKYCHGESSGDSDSQSFTHEDRCAVLKIKRLRETTRGE